MSSIQTRPVATLGALAAVAGLLLAASEPAGAAAGDILVADRAAFADGMGGVIRVNPTTGARTTVSENTMPMGAPDFAEPKAIALEADGDILVADPAAFGGAGGVIRIDSATGARTTVSSNGSPMGGPSFSEPNGIAIEADGDIVVADQESFGGTGGVIRVDPTTGARTAVSENTMPMGGPDFSDPFDIAVEADGDIVVIDPEAFVGTGGVIRVDPTSGARTAVSENTMPMGGPSFFNPLGIGVEADGDILVADTAPVVIRVDPTTGARTTVSDNTMPMGGPSFVAPSGVGFEADGDILVADLEAFGGTSGGVIRVDPTSGARTAVSENTMPMGGPSFVDPLGITVEPTPFTPPPPPPSGGPSAGPSAGGDPGQASLVGGSVKLKKGAVALQITCAAGPSCAGDVTLQTAKPVELAAFSVAGARKIVQLGNASFSILAGRIGTVSVSLSRGGRKLFKRRAKVAAQATLTTRGAATSRSAATAISIKKQRKRSSK